ncbi:MAG: PQQ-binding-like beta-propeller repeat protein [Planctomycetota bacterium]
MTRLSLNRLPGVARPRMSAAGLFAALVIPFALAVPSALADGTVAWRVPLTATYAAHHGAVAPDGTVYVQDVQGKVYAVGPSGQLRWTYQTGGLAEGPVVLGPDGTIYAGGNPAGADVSIHAINPDGTRRWMFTDPGVTQGIIAGPAVGPDGNVYAVTELTGLGAFSVSGSTGQLLWNDSGAPAFNERGQTGAAITFGPQQSNGVPDQFYIAFDMFGTAAGTGELYAYSLNGSLRQRIRIGGDANVGQFQPAAGSATGAVFVSSFSSSQGYRLRSYNANSGNSQWSYPDDAGPPTNILTQPTVGPDATIYIMRNLGQIHAVNQSGSNRWIHSTSFIFNEPVASPTNNVVVAPGRITFGEPGFVKGLNVATGGLLWTIPLPDEAGVRMIPFSRPWFSPDGRRAYITTTLPGSSAGGYLYAIDLVTPTCPADFNSDGTLDFFDYDAFVTCFEGGTCSPGKSADFDADGTVDFFDYDAFVVAFETGCS